jgi:hypothetical protein
MAASSNRSVSSYAIDHAAVEVDVSIQRRTKPMDKGDRSQPEGQVHPDSTIAEPSPHRQEKFAILDLACQDHGLENIAAVLEKTKLTAAPGPTERLDQPDGRQSPTAVIEIR